MCSGCSRAAMNSIFRCLSLTVYGWQWRAAGKVGVVRRLAIGACPAILGPCRRCFLALGSGSASSSVSLLGRGVRGKAARRRNGGRSHIRDLRACWVCGPRPLGCRPRRRRRSNSNGRSRKITPRRRRLRPWTWQLQRGSSLPGTR